MDIDQVYKFWWAADTEFAELDNSEPRSPNMLYDMLPRLVPEGACVLDVGCGEGHHVQKLAAKYKAFGIDPLCNSGQNRSLQRGSVESIPFNDSTFDLIWCRAILMHVKVIGQAFRECFRVLRPGGVNDPLDYVRD